MNNLSNNKDYGITERERADQIASSAHETGRNPLDTAGMDTDDEIWISDNPDYEDYIIQEWKDKKDKKDKDKKDKDKKDKKDKEDKDNKDKNKN